MRIQTANGSSVGPLTGQSTDDREALTLEVSIVMPCLNEADTLATCIRKAKRALCEEEIDGEIIVADNGSTDGSQTIALQEDARLVQIVPRSALGRLFFASPCGDFHCGLRGFSKDAILEIRNKHKYRNPQPS